MTDASDDDGEWFSSKSTKKTDTKKVESTKVEAPKAVDTAKPAAEQPKSLIDGLFDQPKKGSIFDTDDDGDFGW